MTFLHIANVNFEAELANSQPVPIAAGIQSHPIFLQLQFLPLLYANGEDGVAVTHQPYPSFDKPLCHLFESREFSYDAPYDAIESWGASRSIETWAKAKKIPYQMPPWEVVQHVNSKAFSFSEAQKLPHAQLIHSWEELQEWQNRLQGPKVLKTCFGVSGKGHLFLPADPLEVQRFAEKEFKVGRPLIAEPWVERKFDFSTQWLIDGKSIHYLGATVCVSDQRGRYQSNKVGDLELLFGKYFPQLEQHKKTVLPVLQKMKTLGYFGNVGIDAMIWGDDHLHPIVEINARKTMGWVALQLLKHRFPKQTFALSYVASNQQQSLLPEGVVQKDGTLLRFKRSLIVDLLLAK